LRPWPCGEGANVGIGEGAEKFGLGVGGASNRRAAAVVTAKRGEWALEDADVRREAWYGRWLGVWNVVFGEVGAEMVGEEVSMSVVPVVGLRLREGVPTRNARHCHSQARIASG
jgi:hypothetical protein